MRDQLCENVSGPFHRAYLAASQCHRSRLLPMSRFGVCIHAYDGSPATLDCELDEEETRSFIVEFSKVFVPSCACRGGALTPAFAHGKFSSVTIGKPEDQFCIDFNYNPYLAIRGTLEPAVRMHVVRPVSTSYLPKDDASPSHRCLCGTRRLKMHKSGQRRSSSFSRRGSVSLRTVVTCKS